LNIRFLQKYTKWFNKGVNSEILYQCQRSKYVENSKKQSDIFLVNTFPISKTKIPDDIAYKI